MARFTAVPLKQPQCQCRMGRFGIPCKHSSHCLPNRLTGNRIMVPCPRMKSLLAVLMSFIMLEAPALAIHGCYSLNSASSLQGEYAGVLIPISDTLLVPTATDFGTNSLGLFTLGIPTTGIGGGSAVIFSNGNTFTGTIQALVNPDNSDSGHGGVQGGIIGILNATFNYTLSITDTTGAFTTTNVTASAQGSFDANVVSNSNSVGGFGLDLSGTSEINVNQGFVSGSNGTPIITEQVTFAINGFEQSNIPPTATTTTTGT